MDYKAELNKAKSDLDRAERLQDLMKKANAIIRGGINVTQRLIEVGLNESQAEQLQKPDYAGRIGFAQYNLTNNNALIKRLQDKVKNLETKLKGSKAETEERYLFDGGEVFVNYDIDRVQILFPGGRTTKENFSLLRRNGFVYSPSNKAFQRKITPIAIRTATSLFNAKKVEETELQKGIDIESEHSDTIEKIASGEISPEQAPEEIAKDHLTEDTKYYDKLEEVESKKNELNPRDSWYINREGTPYGIDRVLISLVKNGNNEQFEKDFERVISNPNHNTKEKFFSWKGIKREESELDEKIEKLTNDLNNWVKTGGDYVKKFPKYKESINDIEALKILKNHIPVLSAIAEQYFDEKEGKNEVRPIKQLGTGANVYFESDKYRVNDFRGKYLLNVGDENDLVPLKSESFNDVNEAVFVAKKLNELAPQGLNKNYHFVEKIIKDFRDEYKNQKPSVNVVSTEYFEPNTEEEFDNMIFQHLDETKSAHWIGHQARQRMILKEINSKLQGNEDEKLNEVKRLFKLFYEKEVADENYEGSKELVYDPVYTWITDKKVEPNKSSASILRERLAKEKLTKNENMEKSPFEIVNGIVKWNSKEDADKTLKGTTLEIGYSTSWVTESTSQVTLGTKLPNGWYSSTQRSGQGNRLPLKPLDDKTLYYYLPELAFMNESIEKIKDSDSRKRLIAELIKVNYANAENNMEEFYSEVADDYLSGDERIIEVVNDSLGGEKRVKDILEGKIKKNEMSDFEKERQRQIASGEISPESKAISLSALSKKINAEKKENLSDLFDKFYEVVTFHEDARHGWLEVPKSWLTKLGIAHEISGFSYQKGDSVFLEEDSDLGTFVNAVDKYITWSPNLLKKTYKEDSPIRNYAHYKTPSAPKKEEISQPKITKKAEINLFEGVNETRLRNFIPAKQIQTLMQMSKGEEGSEAVDVIQRLDKIVASMPEPYGSEGVENKLAYLHYFNSSSDWYIIEKDNDGPQKQAFGWVILNGDTINAEYGYIDISSFLQMGSSSYNFSLGQLVELDFYFAPTPIKEIIKKHGGETMEEIESQKNWLLRLGYDYNFKADKLGDVENAIVDELTTFGAKVFREYGTKTNQIYIQYNNKFFKLEFGNRLFITIVPGLNFGEPTSKINQLRGIPLKDYAIQDGEAVSNIIKDIINEVSKVTNEEYKGIVEHFKGMESPHEKTYSNPYELNKAIEKFLDDKKQTLGESAYLNPDNYTSGEMNWLRQYSGYGGLSQFGPGGKGAFFEYYTPMPVIRKMWALAYKYGYKGGATLEPSVATGEFLSMAPFNAQNVTGYEINPYSWAICKILYPSANIILAPFEKTFIKNNFTMKDKVEPIYELAIGNPPYGSFDVVKSREMSMGELDHVKAKNYAEYFIRRGIDLLMPGGLLIYIVGASIEGGGELFLDSGISPVKEYLAEKCDLLDAYRLPDAVFERTGVTSEIIVLQKK